MEETETLAFLNNYLNAEEAEEGVYPNGVFNTIYDEHVLPAETIKNEIEYVKGLQQAAVQASYLPGADVTLLFPMLTSARDGNTGPERVMPTRQTASDMLPSSMTSLRTTGN